MLNEYISYDIFDNIFKRSFIKNNLTKIKLEWIIIKKILLAYEYNLYIIKIKCNSLINIIIFNKYNNPNFIFNFILKNIIV